MSGTGAARDQETLARHLFGQAVALAQAAKYDEAAALFKRVLALVPTHDKSRLNLGLMHLQGGQLEAAAAVFRELVNRESGHADAWHNLAVALIGLQETEAAEEALAQARTLKPGDPDLARLASGFYRRLGRRDAAVAVLREAQAAHPGNLALKRDLAEALARAGALSEAVPLYQALILSFPREAGLHATLGTVLAETGDLAQAQNHLEQAVAYAPQDAGVLAQLAQLYLTQDRLDAAGSLLAQAEGLAPSQPRSTQALVAFIAGHVAYRQGDREAARDRYQQAWRLNPKGVEAGANLAVLQLEAGHYDAAEQTLQEVQAVDASSVEALGALGRLRLEQGRAAEALALLRQACALAPTHPRLRIDLLGALHYDAQTGGEAAVLAAAGREWARDFAPSLAAGVPLHHRSPDPDRPLRVAYLGDLSRPQVNALARAVMMAHDPDQVQPWFYSGSLSNSAKADSFQAEGQVAEAPVRRVSRWDATQLARQLADDQIDIAVNVTGHVFPIALQALARRPAPIQLAWGDVFGSTWVDAIDAFLTDAWHSPPTLSGADQGFIEALERLPLPTFAFSPPADLPDPSPLPALRNGHVTFGSLNRLPKITPEVVGLWAALLQGQPDARLCLQGKGFDSATIRADFLARFAAHGIASDRIDLVGARSHHGMFELYQHIDLALDTFPWSGGLTTLEGVWMGVPVITCPGRLFHERHAYAHLASLDLAEAFSAADRAGYQDLALSWCNRLEELADYRQSLRLRLRQSSLCDHAQHCRALEAVYRRRWRAWCQSQDQGS